MSVNIANVLLKDGDGNYLYPDTGNTGGVPPSYCPKRNISISGNTVSLTWEDPEDTIIDGHLISTWGGTIIVRKQGEYPKNIKDGTVVVDSTTRNQYATTPFTETVANPSNWKYKAFPYSTNGVICNSNRNAMDAHLYGYRINLTAADPEANVEYLSYCDNAFYTPARMDFVADRFDWGTWDETFFYDKIRPCALRYNGTVDFYLSRDNFNYKADGVTASGIANSSYGGNFMIEIPAIYKKQWRDGNYLYVLMSNVKLDSDFECWSCKKSDGTYADNFYLPMFEGTNVSNVLRSYASNGKPTASTTAENEATYAMANGAGWNTTLWADEELMILIFPLIFKSTNSQAALGYGAASSSSGLTCNNDAAITKGMMYGTSGAANPGVNYFGLHNWWGHRWRRPNGLMNASGNWVYKMTHSTVDGSTVSGFNRTGNGYISTGVTPPTASSSYINRFDFVGKCGLLPTATSGSSTTYYCDGMWTNNGQLDQLLLGGSVADGAFDGVFCFSVNAAPSASVWNFGASISYHHL